MNIYLEWYIYNLYILCVGKFGWQDVSGGVIRVLSEADVKDMLLSVAWGWMEEGDAWEAEVISDEANNGMWGQIKLCIFKVNGWKEDDVEVVRWNGSISDWAGKVAWVEEEKQVCKKCDSGEVEDMCHWLLQCSAWNSFRQPLLEAMDNVGEDDGHRTALILSYACRNYPFLSIINSKWSARL